VEEALRIADRLKKTTGQLSIQHLADAGVEATLLKRVLIIEYAHEDAVFDAIVPERYMYKGRDVLADDVGLDLL
jgi:hypothetical protein